MNIEFVSESFETAVEDMKHMFPAHKEELAVHADIPLDPDYAFYGVASKAGLLRFYTAREIETREIIGYVVFFVRPHAHYQRHKWALNDLVWVRPDKRGSWVGVNLIQFAEENLKAEGVHVVHIETKQSSAALGHVLKTQGYAKIGEIWEKRVN